MRKFPSSTIVALCFCFSRRYSSRGKRCGSHLHLPLSRCLFVCLFCFFATSLQVMLDGLAVHKYDHHWLHRNISIVGQEPTLYARSIRDNIIYGLEGGCEGVLVKR